VRSVVACVCACVLAGVAVDGRHCTSTQPPALGCVLQVTQQLFEISCSHARRARAEAAAGRADAYLGYEGSVKVRCSIRCCGASRAGTCPSCALVASCVQVMEKDIPRTFVELGMFAKGGPLEEPLRDILEAYGPLARATAAMLCNAMHRRSVGLCMRVMARRACGRRGFALFLACGLYAH
jgi:hypothetical protein